MNPLNFDPNATFRCPHCGWPIRKVRTDDQPDGVHWYVWQCSGCYYEFGPEWQEGDLPTALLGAEVWTEPPREPGSSPLPLTVAYATKPPERPSKSAVATVFAAVAVAALSMFVLFQQIGQPFIRVLAVLYRTLI